MHESAPQIANAILHKMRLSRSGPSRPAYLGDAPRGPSLDARELPVEGRDILPGLLGDDAELIGDTARAHAVEQAVDQA